MKKSRCQVTIDKNIWELAKDKLPVSRSEFFENQLKLFLNIEDDESKILRDIEKKNNEINVLKDKLCRIREEKKNHISDEDRFNKPLEVLNDAFNRVGLVGRNMINSIANHNNVSADELEKRCLDCGMKIVNFYESPKK